ncbi:hypothetical protein KQX54_014369 [Cotesia glomerata]|uniref:Uncharacterized protein n=1 Tax=Cotesia glomerata TaxID=32391 RepID=A0AAV7J0D3_COTGL|nr:hypothetical protein KQX54_014369 [Cotesia glomerata]
MSVGTGSGDDKSIGEKDDNVEEVHLSSNLQSHVPPVTFSDQQNAGESTSQSGGNKTDTLESETNKNKENGTPWELDAEGLRIFGAEPIEEKPELILHSSVANRWKKYLSEGIKKEIKESLLENLYIAVLSGGGLRQWE